MPEVSAAARTALFARLSDEQLAALIQQCQWASFQPGDLVIRQGEFGDVMYFIMKGLVEVNRRLGDQGPQFTRLALGEGEFFGEMGILEGRPRTANVIALEPTDCLVVNRDQLERLLLEHPSMTVAMLTVMSRRLRAIGP